MWYYKLNNQQIGPVSYEHIVSQIIAGKITPTTVICQAGQKACRAGQHPMLIRYFNSQAANLSSGNKPASIRVENTARPAAHSDFASVQSQSARMNNPGRHNAQNKKKSSNNMLLIIIVMSCFGVFALGSVIVVGNFVLGYNAAKKTFVYSDNETRENLLYRAEQGNSEAQYKLAVNYCNGMNTSEGAKWLKMSAENGYSRAQYRLGVCYIEGDGVPEDSALGIMWLQKASKQGFPLSNVYCYDYGIGVPEDHNKAFKELAKGAKNGYVEAQYYLYRVYSHKKTPYNIEHEEDAEKALYWLCKAAKSDYILAQTDLAIYYQNHGNLPEAIECLRAAAKQGFPEVYYSLGISLLQNGNEQDSKEAVEWIRKAADQGIEEAVEFLKTME